MTRFLQPIVKTYRNQSCTDLRQTDEYSILTAFNWHQD